MKKLLSMLLVFCLVLLALPVLAEDTETADETGVLDSLMESLGSSGESAEGEDGASVLEGLEELFSSSGENAEGEDGASVLEGLEELFSSSGENAEGEDGASVLDSLTELFSSSGETADGEGAGFDVDSLLSALGIRAAGAVNTVEAESAEQFFGTWVLDSVQVEGYEVSLDFLTQFGIESIPTVVLSAESLELRMEGQDPVTKAIDNAEFADGVLVLAIEGITAALQLTEDGNLLATLSADATEMNVEISAILTPAE